MDDISQEFNNKTPSASQATGPLSPNFIEFIRVLARISAKRDYTRHLLEHGKPKGDPR